MFPALETTAIFILGPVACLFIFMRGKDDFAGGVTVELAIPFSYTYRFPKRVYSVLDSGGMAFSEAELELEIHSVVRLR